MGYRADAVANGLDAAKAVEATPYNLGLMDVQMPEMDDYLSKPIDPRELAEAIARWAAIIEK